MHNNKIQRVVYSFVVADLFHYGHLQLLKTAKEAGDLHICGVLSDEAVATYKHRPVANYEERFAVISSIRYVDRVIKQTTKNPVANLKQIHAEYPDATLILIHGDDWREIPGREYVEVIGGEVLQPEYYKRLADSRIADQIFSSRFQNFELFTEHFKVDGISFFKRDAPLRLLSTKATTLKHLHPLLKKARIEKTFVFRAGDYKVDQLSIVQHIHTEFQGKIVVRSSAIDEDSELSSRAGYYESVLDVPADQTTAVEAAISKVLDSYKRKGLSNDHHQVLVQQQTVAVTLSGVIFTRMPDTNAPYYLINYDDVSGRTDTVTAGQSGKLLAVAKTAWRDVDPDPWLKILTAVREIEDLIPDLALDIEFGLDSGYNVVIYQVRPLVVAAAGRAEDKAQLDQAFNDRLAGFAESFNRLGGNGHGESGIGIGFSDMAFWNPAEIIGGQHNRLAYSLYRELITDAAWNIGLLPLGYSELTDKKLMYQFGGKAYIDLGKALHALLPATIDPEIRNTLVTGGLDRLRQCPELHDKIEFEILDSCYLFDFEEKEALYQQYGLQGAAYRTFTDALTALTGKIFQTYQTLSEQDLQTVQALSARRRSIMERRDEDNSTAGFFFSLGIELLQDCRDVGTPAFARQARIAFIANALLISMRRKGHLGEHDYLIFLKNLETVASDFSADYMKVETGQMTLKQFLQRYGHLRPNTYDINTLRYDQTESLFQSPKPAIAGNPVHEPGKTAWDNNRIAAKAIEQALADAGLEISMNRLFEFIKCSLETREKVKFEFTKSVSDALELFAAGGARLGLTRDFLSQVTLAELTQAVACHDNQEVLAFLKNCRRKQQDVPESDGNFVLPAVIFSPNDFFIVKQMDARPNFITKNRVVGELFQLSQHQSLMGNVLEDKIVLIESADPGYDWIFTKRIKGLITRFGGLASHMAIRCAEFGLPAAIGCGEVYYRTLQTAREVVLDCQSETILVSDMRPPE